MDKEKAKGQSGIKLLFRRDEPKPYENEIKLPDITHIDEYEKIRRDIGALITNDFIKEIENEPLPLIKEKIRRKNNLN
jgi:hypothetical protein